MQGHKLALSGRSNLLGLDRFGTGLKRSQQVKILRWEMAPSVAPGASHPLSTQLTVRVGHMLALRDSFWNIFEVVPGRGTTRTMTSQLITQFRVTSAPESLWRAIHFLEIKHPFSQSFYLFPVLLLPGRFTDMCTCSLNCNFMVIPIRPLLPLFLFGLILAICDHCSSLAKSKQR